MTAKRFLGKALNGLKDWEKPRVINTDKAPADGAVLGKLKQLIRPVRVFKTLNTA